jgi:hypothetical protein
MSFGGGGEHWNETPEKGKHEGDGKGQSQWGNKGKDVAIYGPWAGSMKGKPAVDDEFDAIHEKGKGKGGKQWFHDHDGVLGRWGRDEDDERRFYTKDEWFAHWDTWNELEHKVYRLEMENYWLRKDVDGSKGTVRELGDELRKDLNEGKKFTRELGDEFAKIRDWIKKAPY